MITRTEKLVLEGKSIRKSKLQPGNGTIIATFNITGIIGHYLKIYYKFSRKSGKYFIYEFDKLEQNYPLQENIKFLKESC